MLNIGWSHFTEHFYTLMCFILLLIVIICSILSLSCTCLSPMHPNMLLPVQKSSFLRITYIFYSGISLPFWYPPRKFTYWCFFPVWSSSIIPFGAYILLKLLGFLLPSSSLSSIMCWVVKMGGLERTEGQYEPTHPLKSPLVYEEFSKELFGDIVHYWTME